MKSYRVAVVVTVSVGASAEHVFDRLTDWEAQSQWMIGTKVHATSRSGKGIGAELSAYTGAGRIGFIDTMIITAWNPPNRCSVLHTGRIIRGAGDFIVVPITPQSASCTWKEYIILPFGIVGRLAWPFAQLFVRAGLLLSLKRFARWAAA